MARPFILPLYLNTKVDNIMVYPVKMVSITGTYKFFKHLGIY